ncbi:hypothetical protein N8920_05265 [Opitutales bacterium]|nr:hypothetical protein [Opitutales bacterium]
MKNLFPQKNLKLCLLIDGPKKELGIATLGCIFGTTLLLLALQLYQDINSYLEENEKPKNFFTINKKIEGGALVNLGKKDDTFSPDELNNIKQLDGVKRIGGFVRNKFPLTLYIWPSGKVGLGAAAKTDLFFESIPDEFLDFVPKEWNWEEDAHIVPIMVPKFYLDLWNFGLAPSRIEYPTLSTEAATGMPIQIFIGDNRETILDGRFVAFSKRINSVLVPASFLDWANQKFGQPDSGDFYFLWKNGSIDGPPKSKSDLLNLQSDKAFPSWEVSPLGNPGERVPIETIASIAPKDVQPSRIILEITENPSNELLQFIESQGYELNREFPEQDIIKKGVNGLFIGTLGVGGMLSLLSIATFATSFRLVIARSAESTRNLLLLGFSPREISQVFFNRFMFLFSGILILSLFGSFMIKSYLISQAQEIEIIINNGFTMLSISGLLLYGTIFLATNKSVIQKSVNDLR